MSLYLKNISLEEAINISKKTLKNIKIDSEEIETKYSLGRVTYEAHFANISSPHFVASAMDGIATCFKYTLDADINNPVLLEKGMFETVDTGDPINELFDCVIMREDITQNKNGYLIRKSSVPYENIRPIGEDIQMGEMVVPKMEKITPLDISSMIAARINKVKVFKKIKVGIIPTGDEIVSGEDDPKKGELIDYNSWTFKAFVEDIGCIGIRYDIVKDNIESLKKSVIKATNECDVVILNAGSSKGRGDFAGDIVEMLGESLFHGISIKPGKPASLGIINNTPIFGVPGYPVSAFFVLESIIKPALLSITDERKDNKCVEAKLSRKVVSSLKNDEYIRVKLGRVGEKVIASPLGRGAGVTMSLRNADGYFVIPKDVEGIESSDNVSVNLLRENINIDNTLISIGSHDVIMDVLGDDLRSFDINLSSTHTGSMGGIMALRKGETHIAPSHLLSGSGVYNIDYGKKYLGEFVILKFAKRIQGFIVERENPLNIKDFNDLTKGRYVNRQKGSGTRLLLDYNLDKNNIKKEEIKGYDREEITHLTVAAQVMGKSADCGLGVYSAAKYMNLDFIPVCSEDYDILMKKEMLDDYRIKKLIETIKSDEFKKKVDLIGGYDLSNAGEIVTIGG